MVICTVLSLQYQDHNLNTAPWKPCIFLLWMYKKGSFLNHAPLYTTVFMFVYKNYPYHMGCISFRTFCKTFTYTKLKSKFYILKKMAADQQRIWNRRMTQKLHCSWNYCFKEEVKSYKIERPSHSQPHRKYSKDTSGNTKKWNSKENWGCAWRRSVWI